MLLFPAVSVSAQTRQTQDYSRGTSDKPRTVKKSGSPSPRSGKDYTCAITMRSAHPDSTPVDWKVPSCTRMRLSLTDCSKTLRMPTLGSIAMYSPMSGFHSGSPRIVLVKIPVPDPILRKPGQLEAPILFFVHPLNNVIWSWFSQCLANVLKDTRLVTRAGAARMNAWRR
jgi:hypothetical protein